MKGRNRAIGWGVEVRQLHAAWRRIGWLLMATLAGCSWFDGGSATPTLPAFSPIAPAPHLRSSTISQLLDAAGPYRIVEANSEVVELTCSVFEASECWFGETYLESPLAEGLGEQVISELGRDFVANGEFNQVGLRCSRSTADGTATCQVDLGRGFGWEPLPVEP